MAVMAATGQYELSTAETITSFRKLLGRIGWDGLKGPRFGRVMASSSSLSPLAIPRARGRLTEIHRGTGVAAVEDQAETFGFQVRGAGNILEFFQAMRQARHTIAGHRPDLTRALTTHLNCCLFAQGLLGGFSSIPSLSLLVLADYVRLLAFSTDWSRELYEMSAVSGLSRPNEGHWMLFSDSVYVQKTRAYGQDILKTLETIRGTGGWSQYLAYQEARDFVPVASELTPLLSPKSVLSTDLLLEAGEVPTLSVLVRRHPKRPARPTRAQETDKSGRSVLETLTQKVLSPQLVPVPRR